MFKLQNNIAKTLNLFGFSCLLRQQTFLLPVVLLWYQLNGLSDADFIFFQGFFILLGLFFEVPCGYLADTFSKKYVLLTSFSLFLARSLLWLTFRGTGIIIVGEIMVVLSRCMFQGIYDSYVYEYLQKQNQSDKIVKYCGLVNFCLNVGTGSASLVCSLVYPRYCLQTLLILEIITTSVALLIMSAMPKTSSGSNKLPIKQHLQQIKQTFVSTLTNKNIRPYLFLTAIFASSTYVFIWNFQPIMKATNVPVIFFGYVYFCNFLFRALTSYTSAWLKQKINYKILVRLLVVYIVSAFGALALSASLNLPFATLTTIFFICIGIGFQLLFHILTISEIQKHSLSQGRATASSVNNLFSQGLSGLILMSFKFLFNKMSFSEIYLLYLGIFIALLCAYFVYFRAKKIPSHTK